MFFLYFQQEGGLFSLCACHYAAVRVQHRWFSPHHSVNILQHQCNEHGWIVNCDVISLQRIV